MTELSPRSRARWAIREGAVIGGILGFWLVVYLVLNIVTWLLEPLALTLNFEPLFRLARETQQFILPLVLQAATANVALYTLVRVGMLIIDHWRKTSPQAQGA
ncbi:hypothetical protein [Haladaptatus sp. DJG-WS-42]|uniref:hypothetical protein n=1 Tax=Haladaptatus sp. DJG-WS-42 TaxID=3120516 RepID=UPI0030CF3784